MPKQLTPNPSSLQCQPGSMNGDNWLSLRNTRLKLKASGKLPIILGESTEYTPLSIKRKTERYQHITGWIWTQTPTCWPMPRELSERELQYREWYGLKPCFWSQITMKTHSEIWMIAICAANFNMERTQLSGRNSPQIACGHQSLHVIMLLCGDVISIPSPQDLSGTMHKHHRKQADTGH